MTTVNNENSPDLDLREMRERKREKKGMYKAIVTICWGSTVVPWRVTARTLSPMSVASVQRENNAPHTTNTKKNCKDDGVHVSQFILRSKKDDEETTFSFCAPTHCPIPSPRG
jgi:hypothetical protein